MDNADKIMETCTAMYASTATGEPERWQARMPAQNNAKQMEEAVGWGGPKYFHHCFIKIVACRSVDCGGTEKHARQFERSCLELRNLDEMQMIY